MKKLLNLTLLSILMLSLATPAFAQGGHEQPGQVVFGSDRRLEAGDIINGDLVIFGGNLRMADGSRVEGDVVVFGGKGEIDGEIEGDLALIGGSVKLGSTARIEGDVASIGGQVDKHEDAYVRGEIIETTQLPLPPIRAIPPRPDFGQGFRFEPMNQFLRIVLAFTRGLVVALVIAAIGLLVVLFLPDHTQTVGQTIRQTAPTSFGLGLLTLLVGILAIALLFATCCLGPVGFLVALALVLATLYGWIVVGLLLGERMLRAIQKDKEPTPTASALVGVFVVTVVQQGLVALQHLPCLGFFFWLLGAILWLLVASTGLGAVVLTRFGTQPYTGVSPAATPPALPPTLPPPPEPEPPEIPSDVEPEVTDETGETEPEPGGEPPVDKQQKEDTTE